MNVSWCIFVQWHWLKQNVVWRCCTCNLIDQINNFVDYLANLECVWVHLLADFTFKSLPVERSHVLICRTWRFFLLLCKNPRFEALEVDQTNRTFALTGNDQWVSGVIFVSPADTALDVFLWVFEIFSTFYFHSFSKFLLIQLVFRHVNFVASKVFNSKSYSSQLNGVKFLNFVIVLSWFVFQRSSNKPKSIYRFFLLVFAFLDSMIKEVTLYRTQNSMTKRKKCGTYLNLFSKDTNFGHLGVKQYQWRDLA